MMALLAGAMAQTLPSKPSAPKRVDKPKATAILKGEQGAEQDLRKNQGAAASAAQHRLSRNRPGVA